MILYLVPPKVGKFNADFVGQISNIKRAVYVDCHEANNWDKTEKETLQEKGIKPMTNEERLAQLKGQDKAQGKLF